VKVKHSRHSGLQLAPARQSLAMVHTLAADFAAEVAALCAIPVNPAQWRGFLDRHVPRTDPSTGLRRRECCLGELRQWQAVPMTSLDPLRSLVFGANAEAYERARPGYPDAAVDWLLPRSATRVADVGAGTGKLTGALLARGVEVVAVEPDAGMLAVLTRLHPKTEAHLGGADALPLTSLSVDAVFAAQAWHWFPHQRAVAEVRRVLRPGGWLGLVWNVEEPREPWQVELSRLDPDTGGGDVDVHRKAGGKAAVSGLPEAQVEVAMFPWSLATTAAALRARLATHSAYAVMAAPERENLLDAAARVVDAEAARRGTDRVPLSMAAYCARWRP